MSYCPSYDQNDLVTYDTQPCTAGELIRGCNEGIIHKTDQMLNSLDASDCAAVIVSQSIGIRNGALEGTATRRR